MNRYLGELSEPSGGVPAASRRQILLAVCCGLVAPARSMAEATSTIRRVAHLGITNLAAGGHLIEQLLAGLRDLGWVEGRNLIFDMRFAEGDPTRLPALTNELLALKPDVFVASTDGNAMPAAAATKEVPIVFVLAEDPVMRGLVDSLARPGRNVTGYSVLGFELGPKRLQLLKEAVPGLRKVGVKYRSGAPTVQAAMAVMEHAAGQLRLELVPVPVETLNDLPSAMERLASSGATGLVHIADPLFFLRRKEQADLAIKYRIAAIDSAIEAAKDGALLAYGANFSALYRRIASLVDRLLKGADPATTPVEQPNVYELAINLRTARALGMRFPQSLLIQATTVIE